jgi:hypothetical protein
MLRLFILAAFVAVAALAVYSFYDDNRLVEAEARRVACVGHAGTCAPRLARLERTPLRQTFAFRIGTTDVGVTCRHAFLLVGAYACERAPSP